MMSVWISGYIVTLYYSISVRLHSSLPACFFLSVFHLLRSLCLLSLRTVPVCFISLIPSPLLFFMLFLFPSSSLPLLSCHSVSLLSPSALHSFFCLFFLLLSLWTCTRFSVFSFLSFLLSPTPSTSIPILDVMPGRGSWRLSPRIVGCCRGLQRPRQNLRAVCHHCVQTQPRRQRGLLEDLPTLLGLPRLPYEDHWDGVFRKQWYFYLRRNLTLWSKYSWTCVVYSFCFSLRTWRQSSSCQGKRPSTTWTETSWRRGKRTSMLTYR